MAGTIYRGSGIVLWLLDFPFEPSFPIFNYNMSETVMMIPNNIRLCTCLLSSWAFSLLG